MIKYSYFVILLTKYENLPQNNRFFATIELPLSSFLSLSLASSIGPTFVFLMLNFELFIEVTYLKDSHSNSTQNENLYSFNCISCHLKPPLSIHQTQDTNIRFTKKNCM